MEGERIVLVDNRHAPLTPTVRDLVAILFRQKRILLISFVALFVLVALWGAMRPAYRAEMKILVRRERMDPIVTPQQEIPTQVIQPEITESEMNSEVELVKSPDLLEKLSLIHIWLRSTLRSRLLTAYRANFAFVARGKWSEWKPALRSPGLQCLAA